MKTRHVWLPPRLESSWNVPLNLTHNACSGDSNHTVWLHEPREVIEVMLVGSVVGERVDRNDGVEEIGCEGEGTGVGVYRINTALRTSIANPLEIFGSAEPQVSGPDFDIKLTMQEYRRHRSHSTQIQ